MREIKFRAWDSCEAELVRMYYFKENWIDDSMCEGDCVLMQYTGFKDKNDTEIYFDDIYFCELTNTYKVVDELTVAMWIIDINKMNNPMAMINIVGNRYENPELLQ